MSVRKRLGKYQLVKLLGRGGMAEVWEAYVGNDRANKVAIKTLPFDSTHTGTSIRHLLDEAGLGIRLVHSNLVRTLDVVEEGRRVGIVMELLDGVTVGEICRPDQVPPLGWTVAVALDVLAGLEHLHAATTPDGKPLQLVHRDLKPSNLFVTRNGTAKIIDFGIAHLEGTDRTQTRTGMLRGSVPYCSPEMARHEPLDARSDLFSFGLVFYELLTGRRCFAQKSEAAILSAVLWSPIQPVRQLNPEVPGAVEALIAELLEKDPKNRPASARIVRERLEVAVPCAERFDRERVAVWIRTASARRTVEGHTASASRRVEVEELLRDVSTPPEKSHRGLVMGLIVGIVTAGIVVSVWTQWDRRPVNQQTEAEPPKRQAPSEVKVAAPVEVPKPVPEPIAVPKGKGWLTVGVGSGWAQIRVDGKDLGPTPLFRRELTAGRHVVIATRKDGSQKVHTLIIEPRKEKKLVIVWEGD